MKKALRHWVGARAHVCVATISVGSAAVWLAIEPIETPKAGVSSTVRQDLCQLGILWFFRYGSVAWARVWCVRAGLRGAQTR